MEIRLNRLQAHKLQFRSSAVWDRDIILESPAFIHINAPSGTGKTTLMSFIYGLRFDYEGDLLLKGKAAATMNLNEWSALRSNELSVVFQDLRLFPSLSALENIEIKSLIKNTSSTNKIREMAATLGIESKLDQKAGTLSQGEKQRVAIIRALTQPFEWLIMDEPFSHLDDANIEKASSLITEVCQSGNAGFILASLGHDYSLPCDKKLDL